MRRGNIWRGQDPVAFAKSTIKPVFFSVLPFSSFKCILLKNRYQFEVFTFRADVENKVLHPEADLKGEMYAGILFVGIFSSNFLVVLLGSREIFSFNTRKLLCPFFTSQQNFHL